MPPLLGSNRCFEGVWRAGFGEVDLAKWIWQTGFGGFDKRIQQAKVVIMQGTDIMTFSCQISAKWIPPGFPGEKASR
ncbi:MAG: hypothetical protein Q8O82_07935 [Pseudorhodobacter sp.]|nr:hypothetical protein [Pseudorhodobacter sp.]